MNLSGIFNFIIGFLLAILLLTGASVAAALYFAAKLTAAPERPTFPNEVQNSQSVSKISQPIVKVSPEVTPSESPTPKPLEAGAYRAIVTQPIGLILRDSPTREANRIGGIAYKEKVVVLEDTPDKEWQRVRIEDNDSEGWVKGGNTEKIN
jgi:Bacterial SH3 domain